MQTVLEQHISPVRCLQFSLVQVVRLTLARGLKPGQKTLDAIGGAHKLQSWPHNILTGETILNVQTP